MRPLGELDLGDELRLDPDDVGLRAPSASSAPRGTASRGARAGAASSSSRRSRRRSKPVPTLPAQRSSPAVVDGRGRARRSARAPALPLRVAGDHELLAAVRLDLQPVARAPCPAGSGESARLPTIPSSPCSLRGLEQRRRRRRTPRRARPVRVARSSSARSRSRRSRERQVDERLALDLEQVEDVVDDGVPGLPCCIAEKLGRPASSSAQTSPSSTQSGVFTACASCLRDARGSARSGRCRCG